VTPTPTGSIDVQNLTAEAIGDLAASIGATLHELSPRSASLEDVFLQATAQAQEYRGTGEVQP
jgi:ABC-2 type transport system ATP-binding protein